VHKDGRLGTTRDEIIEEFQDSIVSTSFTSKARALKSSKITVVEIINEIEVFIEVNYCRASVKPLDD
jgi:hypothetical protein